MKKPLKLRVPLTICLFALSAVLLACNTSAPKAPTPVAGDPDDLQAALRAEVVDDRPEVLATLGRPDAFDISIVLVEGGKVRMESWRYYQFGTRVDFVDGEAIWTVAIEPLPDGTLFAAWYDPLAFETGMTGAEIAQMVAAASPAGAAALVIDLSAGGEDLAGGTALIGDQIMVGLYQDELVYVETVALMPEGGD